MATLGQVVSTAQSAYLNDPAGVFWTDAILIPFIQEAHRELQLELQINGVAVIKTKSAIVTIPAVDLESWTGEVVMPDQPTNLIEPLECWERPTGDTLECDWNLMIKKSWVPETQPVNDLVYWNWVAETIKFLGAMQDNDIKLYYNAGIAIPQVDTDPLGFINSETFLAPRASALALSSVGADAKAKTLNDLAATRIDKILQYNTLGEQDMIVRRRPYRHGRTPFMIR